MVEDFKDGVILCKLLEKITNQTIRGCMNNPKFPMQKLGNITVALDFLKNQGIYLESIGPAGIFNIFN